MPNFDYEAINSPSKSDSFKLKILATWFDCIQNKWLVRWYFKWAKVNDPMDDVQGDLWRIANKLDAIEGRYGTINLPEKIKQLKTEYIEKIYNWGDPLDVKLAKKEAINHLSRFADLIESRLLEDFKAINGKYNIINNDNKNINAQPFNELEAKPLNKN